MSSRGTEITSQTLDLEYMVEHHDPSRIALKGCVRKDALIVANPQASPEDQAEAVSRVDGSWGGGAIVDGTTTIRLFCHVEGCEAACTLSNPNGVNEIGPVVTPDGELNLDTCVELQPTESIEL